MVELVLHFFWWRKSCSAGVLDELEAVGALAAVEHDHFADSSVFTSSCCGVKSSWWRMLRMNMVNGDEYICVVMVELKVWRQAMFGKKSKITH